MSWHYIEVDVSNSLERISATLFKREQEKASEMWEEIMNEARNALRVELSEFVGDWRNRLSGMLDGKAKRIQGRSINILNDWLDRFSFGGRDLTNDEDVQEYVSQLRLLFSGMNAKVINKETSIQQVLKNEFDGIAVKLSTLLEDTPTRFISRQSQF
jgi:hypothetical protein